MENSPQDTDRLFPLIRAVRDAALVETAAIWTAIDDPTPQNMLALRESHLREIDAVHALAATVDLITLHRVQITDPAPVPPG